MPRRTASLSSKSTYRIGALLALIGLLLAAGQLTHKQISSGQNAFIDVGEAATQASINSRSGKFVSRDGSHLKLGDRPFYFAGANFYSAMVNAAGGPRTRQQTTEVFQMMQDLGLTVLRTWAFNDHGVNNTWQALQTRPGVFEETVFRDGLDWIISEAPKYGVKLLLTLTNYQLGYGGAMQYVKWANKNSILDFFTDPIIRGWYTNNVKTIVTRRNSLTGIEYRDDPAIFGWELINEPHVPGDDTGSVLTEWIDTHSLYLKTLDMNHLVGVGVEGFYGRSTPEMLPDNPAPNLGSLANGNNPAPYSAICEGQDFVANHASEGIDFTSIHLYPDYWASTKLEFQLSFASRYITGHSRQSARLGKPLLLSEFGKYPPIADRNAMLRAVYKLAADSAAAGDVLAGTMIWTLGTTPEFPYVNGFDAFNVYTKPTPYLEAAPRGYIPPTEAAASIAEMSEFYGWANQTACNAKYIANPMGLLDEAPSLADGWNETLAIIRQAAKAVSHRL